MIEDIIHNLKRGQNLVGNLTATQFTNDTVPPYFSSIACHLRHVLDIFSCVLDGLETSTIDLTNRERNELIEQNKQLCFSYFKTIISKINKLTKKDLAKEIMVLENVGTKKIVAKSTLAAVLLQANSHATHHYASIGYILYQLQVALPDADFGFNPSSPKKAEFD